LCCAVLCDTDYWQVLNRVMDDPDTMTTIEH